MKQAKGIFGVALTFFCIFILSIGVFADDARDYVNAPVNMNMPGYYFTYSSSDSPTSASWTDNQMIRYTRTLNWDGRTSGLNVFLPYLSITSQDKAGSKSSCSGFGDFMFLIDHNLFGAPAMNKEEFMKWKPTTYMSAHLLISAPTGDYDKNRALNPGCNRWSFNPKLNYSYTPNAGLSWLEVYGSAKFSTDNPAYAGSNKLSQDTLYTVEGHYSRNIKPKLWYAVDAYYSFGGENVINNIRDGDGQNTLSAGCTLTYSFRWGGSVLLKYMGTVYRPPGQSSTNSVQLYVKQLF